MTYYSIIEQCIYAYMRVCVYIYIYIYTYIHIHTYMHAYIHTYLYTLYVLPFAHHRDELDLLCGQLTKMIGLKMS